MNHRGVWFMVACGITLMMLLPGAYAQDSPAFTVVTPSGNVGIGTTTPTEKLVVVGNARVGATGNLFVPGLGENVRVLQAVINTVGGFDNGGSGMTVNKPGVGVFEIDTIFPATGLRPTVVCTPRDINAARTCTNLMTIVGGFWRAIINPRNIADALVDTDISIIMIGNR